MTRLPSRPAAALAVIAVLALAGCTPTPPAAPSATDTSVAEAPPTDATSAPTEPAPAPSFVAGGSADDNLPVFTGVVRSVWGGPDQASGRAYVDALVATGFDKAAMQVTPDQTTIGNPAESIEFSVRWGDQCLVGQVGPSIGDPVTAVLPGLSTGGCLIGQTRAIDW